jgi:hypothetical protein
MGTGMTDHNLFLSGKSHMNGHQLKAQEALEAQLQLTGQLIEEMLTRHSHYTDDCGEYLRSALDLSTSMMSARENGIDALIEWMEGKEGKLDENWATDGVHAKVEVFINGYDPEEVDE